MPKTLPILKQPIVYIPIIVLFLLAVGINTFIYVNKSKESALPASTSTVSTEVPTPTPSSTSTVSTTTPTPTLIPTKTPTPSPRWIPSGKKGFTVSQSDHTVPQLGRGFIDPYDPKKGATQTVAIAVKHSQPVTEVTAVLKTDHYSSTPIPFTLTNGSNTDGQWQGSWETKDTYLYTYGLVLKATSKDSEASVEIFLR